MIYNINKLQINILALTAALSIFSYFLHPIAFIFYVLIIFSFLLLILNLSSTQKIDFQILLLLAMIEIPFVLGMLLTDTIYFREVKDFISMLTYTFYIITISAYLNNLSTFNLFQNKFLFYIKVFGITFSVLGFIKFYLLTHGIILSFIPTNHGVYGLGTSIGADNNIFAMGLLISLLVFLFENKEAKVSVSKIKYISIGLISLAIILSASRRGIVLLALLALILFYKYIFIGIAKAFVFRLRIKKHFFILATIVVLISIFVGQSKLSNDNNIFSKIEAKFETLSDVGEGEEGSFGPRLLRWKYSEDIIGEYSIRKLLIGDGFHYLGLFGYEFGDGTADGYPHNILFSVVHYGGFVGFFFLIMLFCILFIFILQVFYHKKYKQFNVLIATLLSIIIVYLTYGLSSANSIFEIRPLVLSIFLFYLFYFRIYSKKSIICFENSNKKSS